MPVLDDDVAAFQPVLVAVDDHHGQGVGAAEAGHDLPVVQEQVGVPVGDEELRRQQRLRVADRASRAQEAVALPGVCEAHAEPVSVPEELQHPLPPTAHPEAAVPAPPGSGPKRGGAMPSPRASVAAASASPASTRGATPSRKATARTLTPPSPSKYEAPARPGDAGGGGPVS